MRRDEKKMVERRLRKLQRHADEAAASPRLRVANEARGRSAAYGKALELLKGIR